MHPSSPRKPPRERLEIARGLHGRARLDRSLPFAWVTRVRSATEGRVGEARRCWADIDVKQGRPLSHLDAER